MAPRARRADAVVGGSPSGATYGVGTLHSIQEGETQESSRPRAHRPTEANKRIPNCRRSRKGNNWRCDAVTNAEWPYWRSHRGPTRVGSGIRSKLDADVALELGRAPRCRRRFRGCPPSARLFANLRTLIRSHQSSCPSFMHATGQDFVNPFGTIDQRFFPIAFASTLESPAADITDAQSNFCSAAGAVGRGGRVTFSYQMHSCHRAFREKQIARAGPTQVVTPRTTVSPTQVTVRSYRNALNGLAKRRFSAKHRRAPPTGLCQGDRSVRGSCAADSRTRMQRPPRSG